MEREHVEVGDFVMINKESKHYGTDTSNPRCVYGVVVFISEYCDYPYDVHWINETANCYRREDLDKQEPSDAEKDLMKMVYPQFFKRFGG